MVFKGNMVHTLVPWTFHPKTFFLHSNDVVWFPTFHVQPLEGNCRFNITSYIYALSSRPSWEDSVSVFTWFNNMINETTHFLGGVELVRWEILRKWWRHSSRQTYKLKSLPLCLPLNPTHCPKRICNKNKSDIQDPSGQMRLLNCSIIFTWHRKEPTHNKRRARWWQILLTLLWMKGGKPKRSPRNLMEKTYIQIFLLLQVHMRNIFWSSILDFSHQRDDNYLHILWVCLNLNVVH